MNNPRFFSANGTPLSLSNLLSRNTTIAELRDAIADSHSGCELLNRLAAMKLSEHISLDRETPRAVRLKAVDPWGNIHYLSMEKD